MNLGTFEDTHQNPNMIGAAMAIEDTHQNREEQSRTPIKIAHIMTEDVGCPRAIEDTHQNPNMMAVLEEKRDSTPREKRWRSRQYRLSMEIYA